MKHNYATLNNIRKEKGMFYVVVNFELSEEFIVKNLDQIKEIHWRVIIMKQKHLRLSFLNQFFPEVGRNNKYLFLFREGIEKVKPFIN